MTDAHLTRLINGHNVTTEMDCMWLVDMILDKRIMITITFDADVFLTGMRIWNYNASLELSYCGVRSIHCSKIYSCNDFSILKLKRDSLRTGKTLTN